MQLSLLLLRAFEIDSDAAVSVGTDLSSMKLLLGAEIRQVWLLSLSDEKDAGSDEGL